MLRVFDDKTGYTFGVIKNYLLPSNVPVLTRTTLLCLQIFVLFFIFFIMHLSRSKYTPAKSAESDNFQNNHGNVYVDEDLKIVVFNVSTIPMYNFMWKWFCPFVHITLQLRLRVVLSNFEVFMESDYSCRQGNMFTTICIEMVEYSNKWNLRNCIYAMYIDRL